jgi:hypothetical protein
MSLAVSTNTTLSSIGYTVHRFSRGGKMSLPVAPASYIYSHFEHISGVPAPEGTRGVTISRLKILDVLIEQLVQSKQQPDSALLETGNSDEQIDALIEQYKNQIRQAQSASAIMPYKFAPAAPTGAIFNLVA